MDEILRNIAIKFQMVGEIKEIIRYGEGHINETYLVTTDSQRYIMQRINDNIMKDVAGLMRNVEYVTEFMGKKIARNKHGDRKRETLNLVRTLDGKSYYVGEEGSFRVYDFITNAVSYQIVSSPEIFQETARALARFASLMAGFDASKLTEVIKDFHNTPVRYANFLRSVEKDASGRVKDLFDEIAFVRIRREYYKRITSEIEKGNIPLRVTHNDTKLNNVMFDADTNKALAVIDLDTVMPGSILYDFGDAIRFGCNSAAEDESDLTKVKFRMDLFEAFTISYLKVLGKKMTEKEIELLPFSAILMTIECGMRFLGDYIDGDKYFRIHRPKQNLDRARTQFKLASDMERDIEYLQRIVKNQMNPPDTYL